MGSSGEETLTYYIHSDSLEPTESSILDIFGPGGQFPLTSHPISSANGAVALITSINHRHAPGYNRQYQIFLQALKKYLMAIWGHPAVSHSSILMPDTETLRFSYGPSLYAPQTTLSRDLVDIFSITSSFNRVDLGEMWVINMLRLEFFRIIKIKCNLNTPTPEHQDVLYTLLCAPPAISPYYLDHRNHQLTLKKTTPYSRTPKHPKSDLLKKFICGYSRIPGEAVEYMNVVSGPSSKVLHKSVRKIGYLFHEIDSWRARYLRDTELLPDSCYYISSGGISVFGEISSDKSELSLLIESNNFWYGSEVKAHHFGSMFPICPSDDEYEIQQSQIKMVAFLQAHITSMRCTGKPLTHGFFRILPTNMMPVSIPRPIHYLGIINFSDCEKIKNKIKDDTRPGTYIVIQLGTFFQAYQTLTFPHIHHDSGRHMGAISNALSTLMKIIPRTILVGVSNGDLSNTILSKLTSVCFDKGLQLDVSSLPEQLIKQLLPFTEENEPANKALLKSSFLHTVAPVAFICVNLNEPMPDLNRTVNTICRVFGCRATKLGSIIRTRKLVVFDNRAGSRSRPGFSPFISFSLFKPSYPISKKTRLIPPNEEVLATGKEFTSSKNLYDLLGDILRHPTVACKDHLVKHMDRCSSGRVARQPGVGPLDTPISDFSMLVGRLTSHKEVCSQYWEGDIFENDYWENQEGQAPGFCSSLGEQCTLCTLRFVQGALFSITEALLSITLAPIHSLSDITVQLAVTYPQTRTAQKDLIDLLHICKLFCQELNVSFTLTSCTTSDMPGLSETDPDCNPGVASTVATCSVPTNDVNLRGLTPDLKSNNSILLLLTVSDAQHHYASIRQQVDGSKQFSGEVVDIRAASLLKILSSVLELKKYSLIISGHDVSDGGAWASIVEMAIAGQKSVDIYIPSDEIPINFLTSETPGLILEVPKQAQSKVECMLKAAKTTFYQIGIVSELEELQFIQIFHRGSKIFEQDLSILRDQWMTFSISNCLLSRPEGATPLQESDYGNNQLHLTFKPIRIVSPPVDDHVVIVYLLSGNSIPEALMAALYDAGFNAKIISISTMHVDDVEPDRKLLGVCMVGESNTSNSQAGNQAVCYQAKSSKWFTTHIRKCINRPYTFSLAIGPMACEIFFQLKIVGYHKATDTYMHCVENVSKKFESRWLNIHIPKDHRAIAFKSMQDSLIPCWAQGTHLGFAHKNPTMMTDIQTQKLVASEFYGATMDAGPASTYPRNPAEGAPVAGVCSKDGRHLALLHDPTLSHYLWQWPHVPKYQDKHPLTISPWKQMFYDLHKWSVRAMKAYELEAAGN